MKNCSHELLWSRLFLALSQLVFLLVVIGFIIKFIYIGINDYVTTVLRKP